MSNRASIQQETIIVHKTGQTSHCVSVFDNYGQGSICLENYSDSFYEDDLELLLFVLERVQEDNGIQSVQQVLEHVFEYKTGIYIEGTWYDWEQIKPVFDKVWE